MVKMKKTKKLNNCRDLLEQSLSIIYSTMIESHQIVNAKKQIKKAIENIDNFIIHKESINKTNANLYNNWWGNIESGLGKASKLSDENKLKYLEEIEKLIENEKENKK